MRVGGIAAVAAVPVVAANVPSFMQFSAAEWALIIGAIGAVVGIWRQGNKTDRVIQAVVGTETSKGVMGKLDQIHEVSNSTLSEVRAELRTLQAISVKQQEMISDLQTERDKTADIAAKVAAKEPEKK